MTTPWSRAARCLGVALLVGFPAAAAAQASGMDSCGHENAGTIRGVVVNDSTGVPVPAAYIYLITPDCRARSDVLGRFLLHGAPPGTRRVVVGMAGYRGPMPVDVEVVAGDTSYIELRLAPGGPLDDCRALPACSLLLEGAATDNDDTGFRVTALGTAIGLAWSDMTANGHSYACLHDEPAAVREALGQRYQPVVDAESCVVRADPSGALGHRLLHVDTSRPAFQLLIEHVAELSRTRRTVSLGYIFGPHGGGGWDCDFERTDQGWRATLCVETWES